MGFLDCIPHAVSLGTDLTKLLSVMIYKGEIKVSAYAKQFWENFSIMSSFDYQDSSVYTFSTYRPDRTITNLQATQLMNKMAIFIGMTIPELKRFISNHHLLFSHHEILISQQHSIDIQKVHMVEGTWDYLNGQQQILDDVSRLYHIQRFFKRQFMKTNFDTRVFQYDQFVQHLNQPTIINPLIEETKMDDFLAQISDEKEV